MTLTDIYRVYTGSNGDETRALYERLEALGPPRRSEPERPTAPHSYAGEWDGTHLSAERIIRWTAALFAAMPHVDCSALTS